MIGKTGALPSPHDTRDIRYGAVAAQLKSESKLLPPKLFGDYRTIKPGERWPMFGNNKYPNCTFASIARVIWNNARRKGKTCALTDQDVVNAYQDFNGELVTGNQPVRALSYWRNQGVKASATGQVYKIGPYARVDVRDPYEMHSALDTFGFLYVAAGLPAALDDDKDRRLELKPFSERGPKDVPRSGGGHAYDVFGHQNGVEKVVLWDTDMIEEAAWTNYHREEAWVFTDQFTTDEFILQVMHDQISAIKRY